MDPYLLIAKCALSTELLGTLYEAYDNVCADVAHDIGNDPNEIEAARAELARIILSLPRESLVDKALLEISALTMMRVATMALERNAWPK